MAIKIILIYVALSSFNLDVISCEMKCSGLSKKDSSRPYLTLNINSYCVSDISCVFYNSSIYINWTLPIEQDNTVGFIVSYRNENRYEISGKTAVGKNETNVKVNVATTPNASYLIDIRQKYDREDDDNYKGFNTSKVCRAPHIIERDTTTTKEPTPTHRYTTTTKEPTPTHRDTTTTKEPTTTQRNTTPKEEPITTHRDTTTKEEPISTHRYTTTKEEQISTHRYTTTKEERISTHIYTTTIKEPSATHRDTTTKEKPISTQIDITTNEEPTVIRLNISSTDTSSSVTVRLSSLLPVISGIGGAITLVSSTVIMLCVKLRQKRIKNKNKPEKAHGQTTRNDEDDVYNHISRPSTARMSLQTNSYDDTYDHMVHITCDHMDDNTYDHIDGNAVNAINIRIRNKACDQRRTTPGTDINKESEPEYDLAVLHVQDDKNEVNSLLNPYACAGKSVMKEGDSSDVNISRQSGPNGDLYTVVAITDH